MIVFSEGEKKDLSQIANSLEKVGDALQRIAAVLKEQTKIGGAFWRPPQSPSTRSPYDAGTPR